jgi:hypothetical protein
MKKTLMLFGLLMILTFAASAQKAKDKKSDKQETKQKETPQARAQEQTSKINSACQLQADQSAKITAFYSDYYSKRDALRKQKDIQDKKVYAEKVTSLKKKRDEGLRKLLTPEQLKKWDDFKAREKKAEKKADKQEKDSE